MEKANSFIQMAQYMKETGLRISSKEKVNMSVLSRVINFVSKVLRYGLINPGSKEHTLEERKMEKENFGGLMARCMKEILLTTISKAMVI